MFNSLAALSSSSSMPEARSTFTLCIGPIIRPLLVKNRDTSFPSSARRAMASADIAFRRLRVFSIKLLLLFGGFPESHEVVVLSFFVLPHFENDGIQLLNHPTDRPGTVRVNLSAGLGRTGARKLPAPLRIRCLSSDLLLTARSSAYRSETA